MRVIPPVPITSQGSFTRSTTGTCFNSIGLISTVGANLPRFNYDPTDLTKTPTILLEGASTNLCTYSEAFDNAAWTKSGTTVTANNTTSLDGTTNADKLVENTANTQHIVYNVVASATTSYVFSVYVKAAGRNKIWLTSYSSPANTGAQAWFDLTNGTAGTAAGVGGGSGTSKISSAGNGWYRCSIAVTCTSSTNLLGVVYLDNGGGITYTGDGSSGVFLWGAQIETGSTLTSYIPTTSAAVLRAADAYSGTGLLYSNTAESSINMLSRTEDFSNTTYWTQDSCSVTANAVNDPVNNYLTADSVTKSGAKTGFAHLRQQVIVGTGQNSGRTYTGSVWLWCASGTKSAALVISDVDYATYTGTTITVTTTPTRYSFSSNGGGAWSASGSKIGLGIDLTAATNGDVIYCFGAQLEVAASVSSYVPSYVYEQPWVSGVTYPIGAIVTRNTTHRIYTKLTSAAGSTTAPEADGVNWFDSGPDNRWAMFSTDRNVATYNPNSIQILIAPGQRIDSIGLVGLDADKVDINVYTNNGLQYTYSEVLRKRNTLTWSQYFLGGFGSGRPTFIRFDLPPMLNTMISVVLTKTAATAKCSALVVGTNVYLGSVQANPKSEALNFSKIDRDTYGNSILTPRRSVPKTTQELFLPAEYINKVRDARTSLNATPALWSGLDDNTTDTYYEALLILGIYKEFSIDLENQINARVNLQLEEI